MYRHSVFHRIGGVNNKAGSACATQRRPVPVGATEPINLVHTVETMLITELSSIQKLIKIQFNFTKRHSYIILNKYLIPNTNAKRIQT